MRLEVEACEVEYICATKEAAKKRFYQVRDDILKNRDETSKRRTKRGKSIGIDSFDRDYTDFLKNIKFEVHEPGYFELLHIFDHPVCVRHPVL